MKDKNMFYCKILKQGYPTKDETSETTSKNVYKWFFQQ